MASGKSLTCLMSCFSQSPQRALDIISLLVSSALRPGPVTTSRLSPAHEIRIGTDSEPQTNPSVLGSVHNNRCSHGLTSLLTVFTNVAAAAENDYFGSVLRRVPSSSFTHTLGLLI